MSLFFHINRVISRAPGLKLVVETLITSLRPIGNIVLICCAFFIVFGILGVQVITSNAILHAFQQKCEGFSDNAVAILSNTALQRKVLPL